MGHIDKVLTPLHSTLQRQRRFPLHMSQRKILLISVDLFLLNTVLLLGLSLDMGVSPSSPIVAPNLVWFIIISLLWLAVASSNDSYEIKRAAKMSSGIFSILKSVFIFGLIVTIIPLIFPPLFTDWPRFLLVGGVVAALLVLWRVFYARILGSPNFKRRALIWGAGLAGNTIVETINTYDPGYEIIGYIAGDSSESEQSIQGLTRLGNWTNLTTCVQDHSVSDIVLTIPRDVQSDRLQAVLACFEKGVRIVPMPELFEEMTGRIPVEYIGERWIVSLPIDWDSKRLYLLVKRSMDIIISSVGLLVLAPLFPFLILAVKLDSPGPVFYRPLRQGQGGKPIRLWKFRTMVDNADRIGDPTFTAKSDQRITRVGRILRLTHVDELPQFINILAGDMSLVGPRPERHVLEMEKSIPYYRARYAVKPGATGWALVNQGYAEGLDETLIKLQYDLYYIKHQSLALDILILCKSVIHMLSMGGQ